MTRFPALVIATTWCFALAAAVVLAPDQPTLGILAIALAIPCLALALVLRPAILFGGDGVLLNNIAWLLRHLPVFAVGGRGDERIRGIHIDDLAELALAKASERDDSVTDAVGPERPTFLELVTHIREAVGSRSRILRVPGSVIPPLSRLLGLALGDVLLTKDEYVAMSGGLADTEGPATGTTALSEWLADHGSTLGLSYANEIDRHFTR